MGQLSGLAIAAVLLCCKSFRYLNVSGHNNVGDVGLHAIASALHENVTLKSLDVSRASTLSLSLSSCASNVCLCALVRA